MSEGNPKSPAGLYVLAARLLGWCAIGFCVGAVFGLFAIPELGSLLLPADKEIRPWDGQHIGEIVGLLVGVFIFARRNQSTSK